MPSNEKAVPLKVKGIVFSKGSACSGSWQGVVLPGKSHNVPITFNPQVIKNYAGVLTVKSNKNGGNNTLQLSGTGISATPDYLFREEYSSAETGGLSGSSYLTSDGIGVSELTWDDHPEITQYQIFSNQTAGKPQSVESTMNMVFDTRSPLNDHGLPTAIFLENGYYISFGELNHSTGALTATIFQSSLDGGEGPTNGSFTVMLPPASVARRTGLTGKSPLRPNPPDSDSVVNFAVSNVLGFTQLALKSSAKELTNIAVVEFALDNTMSSISLANDSGSKNQVVDLITTGFSAYSCVAGLSVISASVAAAPATAGTSLLAASVNFTSTAISCHEVAKYIHSAIDAQFLYEAQHLAIRGLYKEYLKMRDAHNNAPGRWVVVENVYKPFPQTHEWLTRCYWFTARFESVVKLANSGELTPQEKIDVNDALGKLADYKESYNDFLNSRIADCVFFIGFTHNGEEAVPLWIAAKNRLGYLPRF